MNYVIIVISDRIFVMYISDFQASECLRNLASGAFNNNNDNNNSNKTTTITVIILLLHLTVPRVTTGACGGSTL